MLRSRQVEACIAVAFTLTLSWIAVSLRVYVRTRLSKCFGIDDWFLILSLALYSAHCASGLAAVYHGAGKDPSLIPMRDFPSAVMFWWLAVLFYNLTTLFVRISISIFMHKICTQRTHKWIIWGVMSVAIVYSTFYFFLFLFQCNPPDFFWRRYLGVTDGTCINENIMPFATYTHSAVSAIADWTLGILPIWLIWGLQMNRRTKISVGVLLGLGIFAGIATMIRIPYVKVLNDKKMFLYNIVDVSLWSLTECALGIIAASCAALRPLFKKFYQITTSNRSGHTHSRSHTFISKFRSSSKSKSKSKSRTRSFGIGSSLGHGYVTELHSTPSVGNTQVGREEQVAKGVTTTTTERGRTFYKSDDDSSIELGMESGFERGGNTSRIEAHRGMGSEDDLTGEKGRQMDKDLERGNILVHTRVEVTSGKKD